MRACVWTLVYWAGSSTAARVTTLRRDAVRRAGAAAAALKASMGAAAMDAIVRWGVGCGGGGAGVGATEATGDASAAECGGR